MMDRLEILQQACQWYLQNRRPLPWHDQDPYHIWISEVMLQQTQIKTVLPYFERFMEKFPDLYSLAYSNQEEVLRYWEGLGYYRRARLLYECAQYLVKEYSGRWPTSYREWRKLPGIGDYTAAAIASIAFGENVPVLDGNVLRVGSRIYGISSLISMSNRKKQLRDLLQTDLFSLGLDPGIINQLLMEVGSTICRPINPYCDRCVLVELCKAKKEGNILDFTPLSRKKPIPHFIVALALIFHPQRWELLMQQRDDSGMLPQMWELPGGKIKDLQQIEKELSQRVHKETSLKIQVERFLFKIHHAYTHFSIEAWVYQSRLTGKVHIQKIDRHLKEVQWIPIDQLKNLPMGKVARVIIQKEILDACK